MIIDFPIPEVPNALSVPASCEFVEEARAASGHDQAAALVVELVRGLRVLQVALSVRQLSSLDTGASFLVELEDAEGTSHCLARSAGAAALSRKVCVGASSGDELTEMAKLDGGLELPHLKKSITTSSAEVNLVVTAALGHETVLAAFDERWKMQERLFAIALDAALREQPTTPAEIAPLGLDTQDGTLFVVTGKGRLLEASPAGRVALEAGGSIMVGSDGRLRLRDRAKTHELDRLLRTLSAKPQSGPFALRIDGVFGGGNPEHGDDVSSVWLIIEALRPTRDGAASDDISVILRLKSIGPAWSVPQQFIAQALGLTPSEAQLIAALVSGSSIKEHADAIGRRENTVRWHMANILSKTGFRSQREVVQIVLKLLIN